MCYGLIYVKIMVGWSDLFVDFFDYVVIMCLVDYFLVDVLVIFLDFSCVIVIVDVI